MAFRRSILLLSVVLACGEPTQPVETGIDLTIAYDSTMGVDQMVVWAVTAAGSSRIEPQMLPAPYSIDPPGLRVAPIDLVMVDALAGESVVVRVDARARDGAVVGSGATTVVLEIDRQVAAEVMLGAPFDREKPIDVGPFVHEIERPELAVTTSSEFEDIPGAALTFTPNSAIDRWIVFASGVIGSSDDGELTAEMRLLVNGIEVDRFGHQTLGVEDNEAGFVTFEVITGATEEQVIAPQFRSLSGTTRVKNLRVVALLIPAGADFRYVEGNDELEAAGDDLDLLRLDFTPSRAGEYVVLAKGNITEAPSPSTAQLWLEDEAGTAHPLEGFSSPREAAVPAFIASVRSFDPSPKSLVIRGRSSASPIDGWWNDACERRQLITITAPPSGLPAGHPISVTYDHASEVAAGRSTPAGDDVYVVARLSDGTLAAIDRVVDETQGWNESDTRLWFATVEGETPEYWIYWGGTASSPPSAKTDGIFFFDRFADSSLDPQLWTENRGTTVSNGQLIVGPLALARSSGAHGADTLWEAQVTLSSMEVLSGALEIWTGGLEMGGGVGFYGTSEGLVARTPLMQQIVPFDDPFATHVFAFIRRSTEVVFYLDGQLLFSLPDQLSAYTDLPVRLSNLDENATMAYDWVRVRRILPDEPVVAAGAIEAKSTFSPSRFSYRKLIAFSADAFARALHAENEQTVSSRAPAPTPIALLDAPAPSTEVDEVLIAAARISGESSAAGRKSGEIRAGDEVLIRTSHRIDRDSSRANGYHHVVGVVDARVNRTAARYQIDIASPDGIRVDGAGADLVVLSYPSRP